MSSAIDAGSTSAGRGPPRVNVWKADYRRPRPEPGRAEQDARRRETLPGETSVALLVPQAAARTEVGPAEHPIEPAPPAPRDLANDATQRGEPHFECNDRRRRRRRRRDVHRRGHQREHRHDGERGVAPPDPRGDDEPDVRAERGRRAPASPYRTRARASARRANRRSRRAAAAARRACSSCSARTSLRRWVKSSARVQRARSQSARLRVAARARDGAGSDAHDREEEQPRARKRRRRDAEDVQEVPSRSRSARLGRPRASTGVPCRPGSRSRRRRGSSSP